MSLPKVCNTKQGDIENTAQNILEARLQYPDKSLAELYAEKAKKEITDLIIVILIDEMC